MSIRQQMADYLKYKVFGLTTPFSNGKLLGASEDVCCEIYNLGDEDITADNFHPMRARMFFHNKTPNYWLKLVCKPGEWLFLPHGMYNLSTKSGRPVKVTINRGDTMFIGNKQPSRPEVKKVRSFL